MVIDGIRSLFGTTWVLLIPMTHISYMDAREINNLIVELSYKFCE